MKMHKHQEELPSASGAHFELKTAYEPVTLLLWEQPGQNKSSMYFSWPPSHRNAFPHPVSTQPTFHFCRTRGIHISQCNQAGQLEE